jgi:hypothetical protein
VSDTNGARAPSASGRPAVWHLLAAVQQALTLPQPRAQGDRLLYLTLLEQRASVAAASIGRLLADPGSGELDFQSEGDHILHQIADLPPQSYRHEAE